MSNETQKFGSSRKCVLFKRLAAIIPDQNEMNYLLPEMRGFVLPLVSIRGKKKAHECARIFH